MPGDIDLKPAMKFIAELKKNNNREWFEANKARSLETMDAFERLVAAVLAGVSTVLDLDAARPKDCIMRIYRDARFSNDKRPYKNALGARFMPGGKRSGLFGYVLHLEPGGESMVACGMYDPEPAQLGRWREAVATDARPFRKIIGSAAFRRHCGGLWGESLKTAPRGYAADHPEIELLRRRQVCAVESFTDAAVTALGFAPAAIASMKAMKPFIDYLNTVAAA
jgi:uncharacterized protein (TIGR02453 family)